MRRFESDLRLFVITTTTSEAARSFHVLTVHFYGHSTTHWYFAPVWEAILGAALLGTVVIASRRGAIAFYRWRARPRSR